MRWKYRMIELGAGGIFLLWFVLFASPDRLLLRGLIEYAQPVVSYAMDCVEYGAKREFWAGSVMEMAKGQMPIYGYSVSYYGDGMVSEHYKEYVEVLLAEAREESDWNTELYQGEAGLHPGEAGAYPGETELYPGKTEAGDENTNENRVEKETGKKNENGESMEGERQEERMENEQRYPEYESDRLNEEDSFFYITDADVELSNYYYPAALLHTPARQEISKDSYATYEEIVKNYYTIDNSTYIEESELNGAKFLQQDLSVSKETDGPQILIYHTHSLEGYSDSVPGDVNTSIVGVGEVLAQILEKEYGYQVYHLMEQYDVENRDYAYSNALPALEQVLKENPSIQVVIDLHRDAVSEEKKLVTDMDGVTMAQFMFFNGLSRVKDVGEIAYLPNPYLQDNLAFSFQMQIAGETYYPGLTRKIYLKGYRYNMHLKPRSLLIELGAQNNTVQEAVNACVPIARILNEVLTGNL